MFTKRKISGMTCHVNLANEKKEKHCSCTISFVCIPCKMYILKSDVKIFIYFLKLNEKNKRENRNFFKDNICTSPIKICVFEPTCKRYIKLCLIGCSRFCATLVCTIIFDVIFSFYAQLSSFSIRSLFLNTLTFQSG